MTHPTWPDRAELQHLADRLPPLIRLGTSSWTYPGWNGLVYQREYPATGATARMLKEYATWPLFGTVGIDSFFYRPASARTLTDYAAALPAGFRCVSKVWERITAHTFANPRERDRFGQPNPDWLNAELFANEVVGPMVDVFSDHIGPLVLEFQTIARKEALSPAEFAERLDRFFSAAPGGVPYAVELRNEEYLCPEYFAVLRSHGVAHLFNAWTRMPSIGEQLLLHDAITAPFIVARALLRTGRSYSAAVDAFAPYDHIQDANPELRNDLTALAKTALELRVPAYLIVNNRAEGCAPLTIAAVARQIVAAGDAA
ncbi:MAG: DUF72 domain-containing protein [Gemmatimonadales bacterium]|nr:DUF72 domain-containing protein [Gemmatimonadales bacterium]MDZ4390976.1 DUF72 domain-containing protein [Gemmatimonadales bacterium]